VTHGKASAFAGGIFIGKDTVLRLARAGTVPGATPVAPTAKHPGGLLLIGVGALGLGLSDGDILTEVEGQAVRSEGQVVGLVVGARSRHAEQVSAVVFRTGVGERWSLVVAMPYL
jgi:S1-C subfamily serine protease